MTFPGDVVSTRTPGQVAQLMVELAAAKHHQSPPKIFLKAFIAGAFLSFGGLLALFVSDGSPGLAASNPGLVKVLAGFVFPVGLSMIVLNGQELLTSNMMVFPMGIAKRIIPIWSLPLNWLLVTLGNLSGSLFFAAILVKYSGVFSANPYATAIKTATIAKAETPEWHQIFLRGIGCNWLVSIAVWQAAGARETVSKIFALWLPIWCFVACGFDHVVANMFSIPLGIMLGADLTVAQYIRKSFFAAFFGNIVGALLVAGPYLYFYWDEIDVSPTLPMISKTGGMNDDLAGSSNSGGTGVTVEKVR